MTPNPSSPTRALSLEEAVELAKSLPGVTAVEVEPARTLTYPPRIIITGPPLGTEEDFVTRRAIYDAMERATSSPVEWDYGVMLGGPDDDG